jgi:hypothetical protein
MPYKSMNLKTDRILHNIVDINVGLALAASYYLNCFYLQLVIGKMCICLSLVSLDVAESIDCAAKGIIRSLE